MKYTDKVLITLLRGSIDHRPMPVPGKRACMLSAQFSLKLDLAYQRIPTSANRILIKFSQLVAVFRGSLVQLRN